MDGRGSKPDASPATARGRRQRRSWEAKKVSGRAGQKKPRRDSRSEAPYVRPCRGTKKKDGARRNQRLVTRMSGQQKNHVPLSGSALGGRTPGVLRIRRTACWV